jgi:hypothetical protein
MVASETVCLGDKTNRGRNDEASQIQRRCARKPRPCQRAPPNTRSRIKRPHVFTVTRMFPHPPPTTPTGDKAKAVLHDSARQKLARK